MHEFLFLKNNRLAKKLFASTFGAIEVPILNYYRRTTKAKGEKYFFDKIGDLNKNFGWRTKVVPIKESINSNVKILPIDEIREIIKRSRVRTIGECWCRKTFKNCTRQTNTCFVLFFAEDRTELIDRGFCSRVSEKKINQILDEAEKAGLVHQLICCGDKNVFYVICNCCPCCCVSLQSFVKYGKSLVEKSEFVAEVSDKCKVCGRCIERCYFNARKIIDSKLFIDRDKCFGCGLCVSGCENDATDLVYRKMPEIPA
jgi:ferredoxin